MVGSAETLRRKQRNSKITESHLTYIIILTTLSIAVPIIWLHGRTIYFWDGALPFKPLLDFSYLNYSWDQLNALGYPVPIGKFVIIVIPYIVFLKLTGVIWVTQSVTISLFLMASSFGIFYFIRHINMLMRKRIHPFFVFLPSLLYLTNYYSVFNFYDFYGGLYVYAMMPLSLLTLMLALENSREVKKVIFYSVLFSLTVEVASGSFITLSPMTIYFLFLLLTITAAFWGKIKDKMEKVGVLTILRAFFMFISIAVLTNLWWIENFFFTVSNQYSNSGSGQLSVIYRDYATLGFYPGKWLSTISTYPQLFPSLYTNNFTWIDLYYFKNIIFPIIGIIFFIVIMFSLFTSFAKRSQFETKIKGKLYFLYFFVIFFALQGINPVNKYLFFYLQTHFATLVPYFYATRLPFTRLDVVFLSTLLFYMSTYEVYKFRRNGKKSKDSEYKKHPGKEQQSRPQPLRIILSIILVLLLIVYPWYFYTPASMQVYNTGHGNIPETVKFPGYFNNLSNYISSHSNGSDTLILPLTRDFLSMNFSQGNAFADDSFPGYLFGSPAISGKNASLFNAINDEMLLPGSNFSSLLNNINVKFVVLNNIYDPYAHGYPGNTNLTDIHKYIDSQGGLEITGNFGPLTLYKNKYYKGAIQTGKVYLINTSLYANDNFLSLNKYFSTINTSVNKNLSAYKKMSYTFNGSLSLKFPSFTDGLHNHGYYFSNGNNFSANISRYHYLVVTARETNGSTFNGTYFSMGAQTYMANGTIGTYFIKPSGSPTYFKGNSSYTTYTYSLFGNILGIDARSNHISSDGNGSTIHKVTFWIGWHRNSTFPAYLNIYRIGLAKSLSQGSTLYTGQNISATIPSNETKTAGSSQSITPRISCRENNPTSYTVTVKNSTGSFPIFLKQNYNSLWNLQGIQEKDYVHFIADNYGNGWIINKTGNFTFKIVFLQQKTYNHIAIEAVSANSASVIASVLILLWRKRYFH